MINLTTATKTELIDRYIELRKANKVDYQESVYLDIIDIFNTFISRFHCFILEDDEYGIRIKKANSNLN